MPFRPRRSLSLSLTPPGDRPRLLSEADCHAIGTRLAQVATGGGETTAAIVSTWRGYVRWARNRVNVLGEDRNDEVMVSRTFGQENDTWVTVNAYDDATLLATVRRLEHLVSLRHLAPADGNTISTYVPEPVSAPALFSEATYQVDAAQLAATARQLAASAEAAGLLSAGFLEVSAQSLARVTSWGFTRYFRYTWAQCSVTVRDPTGTGSGWAGIDWPDWNRIDGPQLSALALDKCLTARNPIAIEPGRYTTIFEPQATGDLVGQFVDEGWEREPFQDIRPLDRDYSEGWGTAPFNKIPESDGDSRGISRLGEPVVDERITISANPLDPDLGFPPFSLWPNGLDETIEDEVYSPATWIKNGVLTDLAYDRAYGQKYFGRVTSLPLEGAFRMSGGETTLAEMIADTPRGLLVTRLDNFVRLDAKSVLLRGDTRDGLWLIERGKISKSVKNMTFTESILAALNSVEQIGPPQRVFHPRTPWQRIPQPVIVPPLKIRDFSFTALVDAV